MLYVSSVRLSSKKVSARLAKVDLHKKSLIKDTSYERGAKNGKMEYVNRTDLCGLGTDIIQVHTGFLCGSTIVGYDDWGGRADSGLTARYISRIIKEVNMILILLLLVVVIVWRMVEHIRVLQFAVLHKLPIHGGLIGRVIFCTVYTILTICILLLIAVKMGT